MGIRGLPMQPSEWENSCHRIGTCALTGSAALFASIPGSYVIVNGPLWCYFYTMKYIDDSMPGAAKILLHAAGSEFIGLWNREGSD